MAEFAQLRVVLVSVDSLILIAACAQTGVNQSQEHVQVVSLCEAELKWLVDLYNLSN